MKISANRADGETSRIERLARLRTVMQLYGQQAGVTFLHDHKGILHIGFARKPHNDQVAFIENVWRHLENEPDVTWAVADEYSVSLDFALLPS